MNIPSQGGSFFTEIYRDGSKAAVSTQCMKILNAGLSLCMVGYSSAVKLKFKNAPKVKRGRTRDSNVNVRFLDCWEIHVKMTMLQEN